MNKKLSLILVTISLLIPFLTTPALATTNPDPGNYQTKLKTLQGAIENTKLANSGRITYSFYSFYKDISSDVKFDLDKNYYSLKGYKGNFEYVSGADYTVKDNFLYVKKDNITNIIPSPGYPITPDGPQDVSKTDKKWVKINLSTQNYSDPTQSVIKQYYPIDNVKSLASSYLGEIPTLQYDKIQSYTNYGNKLQYYKISYMDMSVTYTIKLGEISSVVVSSSNYDSKLHIYPGKIFAYAPQADEIK